MVAAHRLWFTCKFYSGASTAGYFINVKLGRASLKG